MVTHSSRRLASMITSHTSWGEAASSMVVRTALSLMRTGTLARADGLGRLPLAQRALDRRVKRVETDAEELAGALVPRQEVVVEAGHERADEAHVLARHGGGDRARHRGGPQAPEAQGGP